MAINTRGVTKENEWWKLRLKGTGWEEDPDVTERSHLGGPGGQETAEAMGVGAKQVNEAFQPQWLCSRSWRERRDI